MSHELVAADPLVLVEVGSQSIVDLVIGLELVVTPVHGKGSVLIMVKTNNSENTSSWYTVESSDSSEVQLIKLSSKVPSVSIVLS